MSNNLFGDKYRRSDVQMKSNRDEFQNRADGNSHYNSKSPMVSYLGSIGIIVLIFVVLYGIVRCNRTVEEEEVIKTLFSFML